MRNTPTTISVFPKIEVPPNHRFSIVDHPFWGTPIFGNIHILSPLRGDGFFGASTQPRRSWGQHLLPLVFLAVEDELPKNDQQVFLHQHFLDVPS